jgi:hypothetical protein
LSEPRCGIEEVSGDEKWGLMGRAGVGKTIERHELNLPVRCSVQLEYIEFKFKFSKGVDFMNFS